MTWTSISQEPDHCGPFYALCGMQDGTVLATMCMYENGEWIDLLLLKVNKKKSKLKPRYWMEIPPLPEGEKWGLAKRVIDK